MALGGGISLQRQYPGLYPQTSKVAFQKRTELGLALYSNTQPGGVAGGWVWI